MGNGKRYREAAALIDADKEYRPQEAVALLKQTASANFDETVELPLRTGADPRHAFGAALEFGDTDDVLVGHPQCEIAGGFRGQLEASPGAAVRSVYRQHAVKLGEVGGTIGRVLVVGDAAYALAAHGGIL